MHPEYSRSYTSNAAITALITDHTERKSDRVKIVPAVTEVRPVQRNRFRSPRIDFLIDCVNPHGPDKHHDQDTTGREGREDSRHRLLPRNDSHRCGRKERGHFQPADCRSVIAQQNLLGGQELRCRQGLFGATLKEMRKRNAARKTQEKDAQEFNQSDYRDSLNPCFEDCSSVLSVPPIPATLLIE